MIPNLEIKARGFFEFEVRDGEGNTTSRSEIPAGNLLLDGFFTNIASVNTPLTNAVIRCGTGSAPRTTGMTALTAQSTLQSGTWPLAVVNHGTVAYDAGSNCYIGISTFVSTFAVGQITGNIAEWGIEFNNVQTANRTVTHASALVKDSNGNATTVQVLASEQLIVTYRLETRLSAVDYTAASVVTVNGVTQGTTVTGRWGTAKTVDLYYGSSTCTLAAFSGTLGAHGAVLGGTSQATKSGTVVTGASKIYRFSLTVSEWNLGGGIQYVHLNNHLAKYEFSPALPKVSGQTCVIDFTVTYGRT